MIQILLVDDELLVRSRIRAVMEWEKEGYHIAAECADGTEALEYLKIHNHEIQIVISDIVMNHMNGDELIARIQEIYPHIATIILSGYDDFTYVRATLKHGAVDYLLKHDLKREVLLDTLNRARDVSSENTDRIEPNYDNLAQLQQKFVLNLLSGWYQERREIEANLKILRIPLNSRNVVITIMMLENYQNEFVTMSIKERELYEFTVKNIVNEIIQEENRGIISSLENGRFVILNSFEDISSQCKIRDEMVKLLRRIHFCIQKFMNRSAGFMVGKVVSVLSVRESYEAAEMSLNNYFFQSKGEILFYDELTIDKKEKKDLLLSFEEEQALKNAVYEQNREKTCEIVDNIFLRIKQERAQRESCIRIFDDLSILASQMCRKNNLDIIKIIDGSKSIYEQVMKLERMEKCQEYFCDLFGKITEEMSVVSGSTSYSAYVQKAVAYIKKHYREAVSLSDVAEILQISQAYLSTLFNQDTGVSFTEYLNEIRLEEAGELLKQGTYRQKEIASMCGFCNYPYFSTLFKKKYGMTPKEYIKKL